MLSPDRWKLPEYNSIVILNPLNGCECVTDIEIVQLDKKYPPPPKKTKYNKIIFVLEFGINVLRVCLFNGWKLVDQCIKFLKEKIIQLYYNKPKHLLFAL